MACIAHLICVLWPEVDSRLVIAGERASHAVVIIFHAFQHVLADFLLLSFKLGSICCAENVLWLCLGQMLCLLDVLLVIQILPAFGE